MQPSTTARRPRAVRMSVAAGDADGGRNGMAIVRSSGRVRGRAHERRGLTYGRLDAYATPMTPHLRLGVNIDHVATIRNARGGRHPDPVRAARVAAQAGADGITAHLREDRRHISDEDIDRLSREIDLPLNLE